MDGAPITIVDRLYQNYTDLIAALDNAGEVSRRTFADENFRKSLLLAVAIRGFNGMVETPTVSTVFLGATSANL